MQSIQIRIEIVLKRSRFLPYKFGGSNDGKSVFSNSNVDVYNIHVELISKETYVLWYGYYICMYSTLAIMYLTIIWLPYYLASMIFGLCDIRSLRYSASVIYGHRIIRPPFL